MSSEQRETSEHIDKRIVRNLNCQMLTTVHAIPAEPVGNNGCP